MKIVRLRLEEVDRAAKKKAKNQLEDLESSSDEDSDQPVAYQLDVNDTDKPDGAPFSLLNLPQSLEDIQKYLTSVWEGLSPPVSEEDITGSWYAVIFENKRRNQLYIGKLTKRFLLDENGTVESIELEELKPKSGRGTDLEQPSISNRSYGIYKLEDVIAGPLELIPRKNGYEMKLCPCLLELYTMVAKLDRQQFL